MCIYTHIYLYVCIYKYSHVHIFIYTYGSRKTIRYNGTIEKSAARTPGLTRAHKVYGAVG